MTPTQLAILRALTAAGSSPVSGEALSEQLSISRAAISKAVVRLRDAGYAIESGTHRGHRLVARPDALNVFEVTDGLAARALGREVHSYPNLASTQSVARELAESGAPHGAIVIAEEQSGGRGRLGRAYSCPPGGIWCTTIVRGPFPPSRASLIGLAAGVAVAEAITQTTGLVAELKWPNDVRVAGRKVCGILTEMAAEEHAVHYLLVGIGINANMPLDALPADLHDLATTLREATGRPVPRAPLLQSILVRLEGFVEALAAGDVAAIIDAWRVAPNMLGRWVRVHRWDDTVEGIATGLAPDGALLVQTSDGTTEHIFAGDVTGPPETEVAA